MSKKVAVVVLAALLIVAGVIFVLGSLVLRSSPAPPREPAQASAAPRATPSIMEEVAAMPAPTPTPMAAPVPERPRPSVRAADPATAAPILTRTGGRLVAAIRDQSYYVDYESQPGLRLASLSRAAASKRFAFEVGPFRQVTSEPVASGFHVERAGEIVAAAIALQLESLGYQVSLDLSQALRSLQEKLGERFRIDLRGFPLVATFSGDVRFQVEHSREKNAHDTTARIDVDLSVAARTGGRPVVLYRRRFLESETAAGAALAGASDRARATAAAAVRRFVQALLTDARLEQALVTYVAAR